MSLAGDSLIVYVPSPPPAGWLEDMSTRFPGFRARWIQTPITDDGVMVEANELPPELWEGVTMLCIYHVPRAEFIPNVRFVQLTSAGSDMWHGHAKYEDPSVSFCNAGGCQKIQVAEWAIGAWLSHLHRFPAFAAQQKEEQWNERSDIGITDSHGRRMGILGYGAIGRQIARVATALGMEIYAYTRTERTTPEARKDTVYCVPGTGDPEGQLPKKWFSGASQDAVDDFLAQDLDVLVLCLPLSDATRGVIGAKQFEILAKNKSPKKPFLINVARGPIVDTSALVNALESGLISGAALDVTDPQPLPKGHALWKAPNVQITPHVAWQSTNFPKIISDLLMDNLTRLSKGEPLINEMKRN